VTEVLPAAPAGPSPVARGPAGARTPTALALTEVLCEVLRVDHVPPDSNLFDDLGADSMVVAQFCTRLRKRPDLPSVSVKDVYQHPTISQLVAALAAPGDSRVEAALVEALADVLHSDRVRADIDVFDDLGADSMVVAEFCTRLRKRPDLPSVSVKDVYQHRTIGNLAMALASSPPAALPVTAAETRAPHATARSARPVGTLGYILCGALQLLLFLAYSSVGVVVFLRGTEWIAAADTLPEDYLRAVAVEDLRRELGRTDPLFETGAEDGFADGALLEVAIRRRGNQHVLGCAIGPRRSTPPPRQGSLATTSLRSASWRPTRTASTAGRACCRRASCASNSNGLPGPAARCPTVEPTNSSRNGSGSTRRGSPRCRVAGSGPMPSSTPELTSWGEPYWRRGCTGRTSSGW
jgi:acyl carrier protein